MGAGAALCPQRGTGRWHLLTCGQHQREPLGKTKKQQWPTQSSSVPWLLSEAMVGADRFKVWLLCVWLAKVKRSPVSLYLILFFSGRLLFSMGDEIRMGLKDVSPAPEAGMICSELLCFVYPC